MTQHHRTLTFCLIVPRFNSIRITCPHEGTTILRRSRTIRSRNFYTRPREGGDQVRIGVLERAGAISTHAPARGATSFRPRPLRDDFDFYSRPREGGRLCIVVAQAIPAEFLLTPPQGGRQQFSTKTILFFAVNRQKFSISNSVFQVYT